MNVATMLLAAVIFAAPGDDFVIREGDVVARLTLDVPEEGAGTSRARVRVSIEVRGPAGLNVEGPRLEDGLSAWRVVRPASSWGEEDGGVSITVSFLLEQTKPGVVALPGVVLRVRDGDAWRTLTWPNLLHDDRDVPGIDVTPLPPPSPWPGRIGVGALVGLVALALGFAGRSLLRARTPRPVPAYVRALRTLNDLEGDPDALPKLDALIRECLDARFGLTTRRQTSREMADSCAGLPDAIRDGVREVSSLAELAKYAGVVPDAAQRAKAIASARAVIEACASVPVGQASQSEEKGVNAEAG